MFEVPHWTYFLKILGMKQFYKIRTSLTDPIMVVFNFRICEKVIEKFGFIVSF